MRISHKFNIHYAPPSEMSPQYGERHHWCQWCGLHGTTYKCDPDESLTFLEKQNKTKHKR